MMTLYSADLSPFAARVRMQIYAKGITDIAMVMPPGFGTPKYREANPIGRIPVLDIDGDLMPESEVIAEYIEELYPEPSMLGATPRETAHIRTLARLSDIYLLNNLFMLASQVPAATRSQGAVDLLAGQVTRNVAALDRMIGQGGFACYGRLTMADCALVPALFLLGGTLPAVGVDNPVPAHANVAASDAAIRRNEHAARVLDELQRGLKERLEMMRSGEFARRMAEAQGAAGA